MKGGKDGNPTGPPTIHRGESSSQPHPSAAFQPRTFYGALCYLEEVKNFLQDDQDLYEEFREALIDYGRQKTNLIGLITRVKKLFKDHDDLIPGFNFFLPFGYQIIQTPYGESVTCKRFGDLESVLLTKVEARFEDDRPTCSAVMRTYSQLQDIRLKLYNAVHNKMESLFKEHYEDLYEDSCWFVHREPPQSNKRPASRNKPT